MTQEEQFKMKRDQCYMMINMIKYMDLKVLSDRQLMEIVILLNRVDRLIFVKLKKINALLESNIFTGKED